MAQKKPKAPLFIRFIPWIFPKIEKVFPGLGNKLAVKLFFTPMHFKPPRSEVEFAATGKPFQFTILTNKIIRGHSYGKGPTIVCIHGWSGRGSQFRKFSESLVNSGFRVVIFDGPAHGKSDGSSTDPLEFEIAIKEIESLFYPIAGYITHSFGGTALLFAFSKGLPSKPSTFIAVPAIGEDVISSYARRINASKSVIKYFEEFVQKKYGNSFYEISAIHTAKSMSQTPSLVIQDADDNEIPPEHGEKLAGALPNGRFLLTRGLGHTKILRDNKVVEETVAFLQKYCG